MLGFAITAVFVSYQLLTDIQSSNSRSSTLMLAFVVLCPASLLSVALDPDVGTSRFYLLWTVIALLNAGLFATVRARLTRRLQRPD
jgi:hypothetical protein